jgi:hypothetical protein
MSQSLSLLVVFALAAIVILLVPAGSLAQDDEVRLVPYALDRRPMPDGRDPETLLPRQVGSFARRPFPRGTIVGADEDLNADYTDGRETVNVGFSLTAGPAEAQLAVRVTSKEAIDQLRRSKGEPDPELIVASDDTDPSFCKIGDFIAWSRGEYFFYAKASTPAALDRFMESFPY